MSKISQAEAVTPQPFPRPSELAFRPIGRILRLRDLELKVGFKRGKVYQMIAAGKFPRGIELGPRSVGWKERDIDAWVETLPVANNAPVKRGA
ncbi:MAG: AlpA family phage regulatory protein [Rhodomicrobium sp.]